MIEVSVSGLDDLKRRLNTLVNLDVEGILDEAEAILLNRTRTRFLAETDPDGVAWEPSGAGLARRAKGGTGTLFDTGTLFHSIQAYATGPNERAIGTDVPYGPKHQYGDGELPARVFLGFSKDDLTVMERLVMLRVQKALE